MKDKSEIYNLLNYLTFNTDNYALGVHFCGNTDVKKRIDYFEKVCKKGPAFVDFDMHSLPFRPQDEIDKAVDELCDYAEGDGFIALTSHWLTPMIHYTDAYERGANNSRYTLTPEEYRGIMTEGTPQNKNFTDELNIETDFIRKLKNRGISVIFRPLHEGNGGWFWWTTNSEMGITGEDAANLYIFVYDYFTETQGLDNIIWQFNTGLCAPGHYDWYPGDEYVDMYGTDWYISMEEYENPPVARYKGVYDYAMNELGKKPFALAEYGGDGTYPANKLPLVQTLSTYEAHIDMGAKSAFLGIYFDLGDQDCTLTERCITLDKMADYRKKVIEKRALSALTGY